jgi:DNA-binding transcriptional ArsR family regulator
VVNFGGQSVDGLNRVFDALANEHRREMVLLLALRPRSISQLAEIRGLSLPAIHKHVRVLEEAAMVSRRKLGRTNFLALERDPISQLQAWTGQFHPWWGIGVETLENYADVLGREQPSSEEAS